MRLMRSPLTTPALAAIPSSMTLLTVIPFLPEDMLSPSSGTPGVPFGVKLPFFFSFSQYFLNVAMETW